MTRREFAAWLTVAFLAGSAVTPTSASAGAHYYMDNTANWAVRKAVAHVCEVLAMEHNARYGSVQYTTARCWR